MAHRFRANKNHQEIILCPPILRYNRVVLDLHVSRYYADQIIDRWLVHCFVLSRYAVTGRRRQLVRRSARVPSKRTCERVHRSSLCPTNS